MDSKKLFSQMCILEKLATVSKKHLFQEMADQAIKCGAVSDDKLKVRDIVSAILERERLGSTGVGSGVAIPHARLEGLSEIKAVFARLETPLDYEAPDARPVDLVVLLLAPAHASNEHLKALAQISRLMRREDMRMHLRQAPDAEALYLLLTESRQASAA